MFDEPRDDVAHGVVAQHSVQTNHNDAPKPTAVANPAPLGLLAFGMTTIMLMFYEVNWETDKFNLAVLGFAAFYGGIGQLLAGMWAMYKNNVFAATAFSSYGCFWLGWLGVQLADRLVPEELEGNARDWRTGEALWLLSWGVLTSLFAVVTIFGNKRAHALQTVFVTLAITFFLLGAGKFPDNTDNVRVAGGYVGFICGSTAIYTGVAELYEETIGVKLPGLP